MSPQEDHVRQDSVIAFPWSPLHTCLSTASGDYLNGENILHTREMLKKRTVSQFAFICTSSHHHITGQFDGSDNLPYLRFISLHVDMKANFRHPIQTEKYATNYHIGLDLLISGSIWASQVSGRSPSVLPTRFISWKLDSQAGTPPIVPKHLVHPIICLTHSPPICILIYFSVLSTEFRNPFVWTTKWIFLSTESSVCGSRPCYTALNSTPHQISMLHNSLSQVNLLIFE